MRFERPIHARRSYCSDLTPTGGPRLSGSVRRHGATDARIQGDGGAAVSIPGPRGVSMQRGAREWGRFRFCVALVLVSFAVSCASTVASHRNGYGETVKGGQKLIELI